MKDIDREEERGGISELLRYKERFELALKAARVCVFEVDLAHQRYTFFENAQAIFGVSGERILREVAAYSELDPAEYQRAASDYFTHPDDASVISRAFCSILDGKSATYQARMKAGNTKYIWCKVDVTPIMEEGVPVRMIGVITDISEMKARAELLERESKLDGFTCLYTKIHAEALIRKRLNEGIGKTHALILFDLDNFKEINDTYGHIAGDQVLKSVADHLKTIFRKTDIVGRFGGDEFIVLLSDLPGNSLLLQKLDKLLKSTDNTHQVTKSIGVALYPNDATDFQELLDKADRALYRAKRQKNTYALFSQQAAE